MSSDPSIKKQLAQQKDTKTHYDMGEQAAWRGLSVDAMPQFKKASRASAWLKGHADGSVKKQQQAAGKPCKAGLKRMAELMAEAFKDTV
jgi:hypothetical protein